MTEKHPEIIEYQDRTVLKVIGCDGVWALVEDADGRQSMILAENLDRISPLEALAEQAED